MIVNQIHVFMVVYVKMVLTLLLVPVLMDLKAIPVK